MWRKELSASMLWLPSGWVPPIWNKFCQKCAQMKEGGWETVGSSGIRFVQYIVSILVLDLLRTFLIDSISFICMSLAYSISFTYAINIVPQCFPSTPCQRIFLEGMGEQTNIWINLRLPKMNISSVRIFLNETFL